MFTKRFGRSWSGTQGASLSKRLHSRLPPVVRWPSMRLHSLIPAVRCQYYCISPIDYNMHQIKIKPNERKGPVRVDVTLHNTSHGQVQRFKYFPSPDKKTSVPSRAEDTDPDIYITQTSSEPLDETIPLHKRTKGKVSNTLFHLACASKTNRLRMIIFLNGKRFEISICMSCLKQKLLPLI